MKRVVTFEISDEDKEEGECIARFWEMIADTAEKLWKENMAGEMSVDDLDVEDKL